MNNNYTSLPAVSGVNHVNLSPMSFLARASDTHGDYPAVVYGERRYNWRQLGERCKRLAQALKNAGVNTGTTVAIFAANTPELIEAHYGVPMSGGVINAINTRLDSDTIAYILEHGDAEILITDSFFSDLVKPALAKLANPPKVIDIIDAQISAPEGSGETLGDCDYEAFIAAAEPLADWGMPADEWQALALNYTSGTSGRPKGVVYHHRGSYLMSLGTVTAWQLPKHPVYLYTVPMFHCNGWGHVWTMAAVMGTMICNRVISAETIFDAIEQHNVTHFGAAPVILGMLADAAESIENTPQHTIQVMTAGAPPPSKVLENTMKIGFNVIHVYGLTETYGHVIFCDWQEQWNDLSIDQQAELKARQGIRFPMTEIAQVVDVSSDEPVPHDGKTMGEIVISGNTVMKGYYKNPEATVEAFRGGWFRSGDLAVVHPDGYLEIKDRLKDIIISGGENISSIEVESAIYKHPAVAAAAVVAKADDKWGETPCAFVELKDGMTASADDIIATCREHMAGYKRPKHVVFMTLPKTSTGKIQKFELREHAKTI